MSATVICFPSWRASGHVRGNMRREPRLKSVETSKSTRTQIHTDNDGIERRTHYGSLCEEEKVNQSFLYPHFYIRGSKSATCLRQTQPARRSRETCSSSSSSRTDFRPRRRRGLRLGRKLLILIWRGEKASTSAERHLGGKGRG